jgi:eukaryotic-like serine/threonine-protein kinase
MIETISHYRVEAELGRGGMGVVYRAVDTRLGRPVALKMLHGEAPDAARDQRFVQEARAASALNHPHIVTIYEIGEDAGTTFIAMELVAGTPLDEVLAAGPLPVAKALEYGAQIASALAAAHAGGIVHRDIKPANIVITRDGRAKVLDFGLAKLVDRRPQEVTITGMVTSPGLIVGTVAYMSPEQAQGQAVDRRSDIFSFGAVLYEMLTGRRPFAAPSEMGLITAILRDEPPAMRSLRPELPVALDAILARALAKDPAARYDSAEAMHAELEAAHAHLTRPADAPWRRTAVMVPAAIFLLAIAGYGAWQAVEARRVREARTEGLREIERLQNSERSLLALGKAKELERYIPEEILGVRNSWNNFNLATQPAGALVELKNYSDVSAEWFPIGRSPISELPMPWGYYRVRLSHPGYKTLEVTAPPFGRTPVVLTAESDARPGMVFVPGRSFGSGLLPTVQVPDFWLDQTEVTNAQYKTFVDAGGYGDPKYWKVPFVDGARTLTFAEAMARFRDATGRPGPATWDLGSFPDGQAEFPVAGISWFEAAAFAEFAGKSLPSAYHWFYAAGIDEPYSSILQFSNFDGKGAVKVAERQGLGTWGTYDMAGNVKEWTANAVAGSNLRYILGGAFNEPNYRFAEQDAQDPWGRYPSYGVRLVTNLGPAEQTMGPLGRVTPDPATLVPVSAQVFDTLKGFYTYDKARPLNGRIDTVDDSSPYYTKQTVSFDSSYSNERVPAFLFLPKNAKPPYQTIILFPNAYARQTSSSAVLDLGTFEYIIRSGRALLYPIYQGTFERRSNFPTSSRTALRDMNVQWAKDFFRAIDYMETRKELDLSKLGYYSLSMGAYFGPIPVALEPRVKVAVFAAGGLRYNNPPETQPANFMPHVKVPVLLVNGKDDFSVPIAAQKRFFELLGTAPEHKRYVPLEGGHVPQDIRGLFREVLDWYDKYLGAVR